MSISISGWRSELGSEEIYDSLSGMRSLFTARAQSKLSFFVAESIFEFVVEALSGRTIDAPSSSGSVFRLGLSELSEARKIIAERGRKPDADVDFEIVLFPLSGSRGTLLMPFCESKEFVKEAVASVFAKPFGWSNAEDCPSDIPEPEWDERERLWREVLDDFSFSPADAGMTLSLVPSKVRLFWTPEISDVMEAFSSPHLAKARMARRIAENLDFSDFSAGGKTSVSQYLEWRNQVEEGLRPSFHETVETVLHFCPDMSDELLGTSVIDAQSRFNLIYRSLAEKLALCLHTKDLTPAQAKPKRF